MVTILRRKMDTRSLFYGGHYSPLQLKRAQSFIQTIILSIILSKVLQHQNEDSIENINQFLKILIIDILLLKAINMNLFFCLQHYCRSHCSRLMDNISDRDISHLSTYVQYALYGKHFSFLFVFLYKVKHNAA